MTSASAVSVRLDELDPASPREAEPAGLFATAVRLLPHQLALLHRCRSMERRVFAQVDPGVVVASKCGVIGDKAGAGKSLVVLALCSPKTDAPLRRPDVHVCGSGNVVVGTLPADTVSVDTNVVVVPHGLLPQWESCLGTHAHPSGHLRWRSLATRRHVDDLTKEIEAESCCSSSPSSSSPAAVARVMERAHVWLVSNNQCDRLACMLQEARAELKRLFIDEAHCVRSPVRAAPICYRFCWFVTSCIEALLSPSRHRRRGGGGGAGSAQHLWDALTLDVPACVPIRGVVRNVVAKNADAFVDASLGLPAPSSTVVACDPAEDDSLRRVVRASAEDCVRSLLAHARRRGVRSGADEVARRVCDEETPCVICHGPPRDRAVTVCCTQVFCVPCLHRWFRTIGRPACPICKSVAEDDSAAFLCPRAEEETLGSSNSKRERQSKADALVEFVRRHVAVSPGRTKVVVVWNKDKDKDKERDAAPCRTTEASEALKNGGARFDVLKGSGSRIARVVSKYRAVDGPDALDVLLVTPENCGAGLNLGNTTDVVFWGRSSAEVERRVLGSAQRLGRTLPLRVWYLMNEGDQPSGS